MAVELNKIVAIRFKAEDHRRLKRRAHERGITLSDFVRAAALGVGPRHRRHDLVARTVINQLSRVGNNLNQHSRVLHVMNLRGQLPRAEALFQRLDEVEAILLRLAVDLAEASS